MEGELSSLRRFFRGLRRALSSRMGTGSEWPPCRCAGRPNHPRFGRVAASGGNLVGKSILSPGCSGRRDCATIRPLLRADARLSGPRKVKIIGGVLEGGGPPEEGRGRGAEGIRDFRLDAPPSHFAGRLFAHGPRPRLETRPTAGSGSRVPTPHRFDPARLATLTGAFSRRGGAIFLFGAVLPVS